jgi:hypothetical protein
MVVDQLTKEHIGQRSFPKYTDRGTNDQGRNRNQMGVRFVKLQRSQIFALNRLMFLISQHAVVRTFLAISSFQIST